MAHCVPVCSLFSQLSQFCKGCYTLIPTRALIILTQQNHLQSHVVSFLNRHKCPLLPPLTLICINLRSHFESTENMFSAVAKTVRRAPTGLQRRSFAKAVRPPQKVREANENFNKAWLSDVSAYPVLGCMAFGGIVVLYEWYHAFDAPDVHIMKGDRKTMDYIENARDRRPDWASHRKDSWLK